MASVTGKLKQRITYLLTCGLSSYDENVPLYNLKKLNGLLRRRQIRVECFLMLKTRRGMIIYWRFTGGLPRTKREF